MSGYGDRTKTVTVTYPQGKDVTMRLTLSLGGGVSLHACNGDGMAKVAWFKHARTAKRALPGMYYEGMVTALLEALEDLEAKRQAYFDAYEPEGVTEVVDRDGDTWDRSEDGWVIRRGLSSLLGGEHTWDQLVSAYGPLTWETKST